MAISFAIAWVIFSPFAEIDDLQEWTFARIETSDLLAIFIPFSSLLAFFTWLVPADKLSAVALTSITIAIGLYTLASLLVGLFLLAKLERKSSFQRVAIIGIIIPLGSLLALAWFAVPLMAMTNSVVYAIPATLGVIPTTLVLRQLSGWVCRGNSASL